MTKQSLTQPVLEFPKLISGNSHYKLVVSQNLEEKIRLLCGVFPSTEWSGTLFYTTQGSFKDGNLIITANDLYLLDIGNSGYTEFSTDASLAGYMVENDLMFCEQGLVH